MKSVSLEGSFILIPPRSLETTLFDRLEKMYGANIKRMLEIQYRYVLSLLNFHMTHNPIHDVSMHEQICSFPSKTLYESKLKSHSSVASHLLSDLPNACAENEDDEKEILQTPVVFFDTAGCEYFERLDGDGDEGSRCNENEATIVHNWIVKLVGHRPFNLYPVNLLTLHICRRMLVSRQTRSQLLLRKSSLNRMLVAMY